MMGHLALGVIGGTVAAALSLAMGQPLWTAALLYVGIGNLGIATGALAVLARERLAEMRAAHPQEEALGQGGRAPEGPAPAEA